MSGTRCILRHSAFPGSRPDFEPRASVKQSTYVLICMIGLADAGVSARDLRQRGEPTPRSSSTDDWRRTNRGWERAEVVLPSHLSNRSLPAISGVHPLLVALLEVLGSLGALVLFAPRDPD